MIESVFHIVDRELWIVTAADRERRGGLLATWVSQASIDRESPAVLVGIARNHFTAELIDASGALAVHLLSRKQSEVAWNFADGSGRSRDKFAELETTTSSAGNPILTDCLAWLDCRVFARLEAGDRNYYWADVLDADMVRQGNPLTEHRFFRDIGEERKKRLLDYRDDDVNLQRPMVQQWRSNLPVALRPDGD